jgi:hypothetical protein
VDSVAGSFDDKYPNRQIFFGCCARAGKGRAKSIEQKARRVIFLCIVFPSRKAAPQTQIFNL